jgi:hypothetical protein
MTHAVAQTSWTAYRPKKTYWRGPTPMVVWPQPSPVAPLAFEHQRDETRAVTLPAAEVAWHEAGHAVVAVVACDRPLWRVFIDPANSRGGCDERAPTGSKLSYGEICAAWKAHGGPRMEQNRRGEVFLNASWASSSVCGWRGRTESRQ